MRSPCPGASAGLTLAAVMGPHFGARAATLGRNVREGRVRLAMGVWGAGPA